MKKITYEMYTEAMDSLVDVVHPMLDHIRPAIIEQLAKKLDINNEHGKESISMVFDTWCLKQAEIRKLSCEEEHNKAQA